MAYLDIGITAIIAGFILICAIREYRYCSATKRRANSLTELSPEDIIFKLISEAATFDPDGWKWIPRSERSKSFYRYKGEEEHKHLTIDLYNDGELCCDDSPILRDKKNKERLKPIFDSLAKEKRLRTVQRIMMGKEIC